MLLEIRIRNLFIKQITQEKYPGSYEYFNLIFDHYFLPHTATLDRPLAKPFVSYQNSIFFK